MKIAPLRMNADYEGQLFYGRPGPQILNQSLESLIFFLENRPVVTAKKYHPEFLDYIESLTHHRPQILPSADFVQNWWGDYQKVDLERKLNSKITSAELIQEKKWCERTFVIREDNDINLVPFDRTYLVKNPYGMSGQRFLTIDSSLPHGDLIYQVKQWIKSGPLIVEPLLDRKSDFSCYVFSELSQIYYENMVDSHYQYKGTIFSNYLSPDLEHLSFYNDLALSSWHQYQKQVHEIIKYYKSLKDISGFSIDSFIYVEDELKIRTLSEVNYRRTMGRVTYELAKRFNQDRPWAQLIIGKSSQSEGGFVSFKNRLSDLLWSIGKDSGFIILTSGDSRFEILYLLATGHLEAEKYTKELALRFPTYNFAVKIKEQKQ
jgi:hypothetical protein